MKKEERERLLLQRLEDMLVYERKLWGNFPFVGGVDEVGRGPLAGPVCAACVVLPKGWDIPGINDSKKLSPKKRDELYEIITEKALAYGVGLVDNERIDEINILNATKEAMLAAVSEANAKLDGGIGHLLVDALRLPESGIRGTALIKGDEKSVSIAAASIVAKVTRDRLMEEYDTKYPGYAFAANKGYGTAAHYAGLRAQGPCEIHRRTFLKSL